MDKTTLKAKAKETKYKAVGFVRDHWKEIVGGAVLIGLGLWLSSLPRDEENESVYEEDYYNFDSNSNVELDEIPGSQSHIQKVPPKRFIGEIDATGSRLKENEKRFLEKFSAQYDRFKGKEQIVEYEYEGWSSDGKYTRHTKTKHRFGDDKMSITIDESYEDDDGQTGSSSSQVELKARNVINYVRANRHREMFNGVRDIVDLL